MGLTHGINQMLDNTDSTALLPRAEVDLRLSMPLHDLNMTHGDSSTVQPQWEVCLTWQVFGSLVFCLMCLGVFPVCMSVCQRVSDPLELESQVGMSPQVGAGTQIQVSYEGSQCSSLSEQPF